MFWSCLYVSISGIISLFMIFHDDNWSITYLSLVESRRRKRIRSCSVSLNKNWNDEGINKNSNKIPRHWESFTYTVFCFTPILEVRLSRCASFILKGVVYIPFFRFPCSCAETFSFAAFDSCFGAVTPTHTLHLRPLLQILSRYDTLNYKIAPTKTRVGFQIWLI